MTSITSGLGRQDTSAASSLCILGGHADGETVDAWGVIGTSRAALLGGLGQITPYGGGTGRYSRRRPRFRFRPRPPRASCDAARRSSRMGDRGWVSVLGGRWARRSWPGSDGYSRVRSPSPRAHTSLAIRTAKDVDVERSFQKFRPRSVSAPTFGLLLLLAVARADRVDARRRDARAPGAGSGKNSCVLHRVVAGQNAVPFPHSRTGQPRTPSSRLDFLRGMREQTPCRYFKRGEATA